MSIQIDIKTARQWLALAVVTQPAGFVYNPNGTTSQCQYEPSTRPKDANKPAGRTGCVVGVAMKMAGIPFDFQARGSIRGMWLATGTGLAKFMTERAAEYLQVAQVAQDDGASWLEAFARAEASIQTI